MAVGQRGVAGGHGVGDPAHVGVPVGVWGDPEHGAGLAPQLLGRDPLVGDLGEGHGAVKGGIAVLRVAVGGGRHVGLGDNLCGVEREGTKSWWGLG